MWYAFHKVKSLVATANTKKELLNMLSVQDYESKKTSHGYEIKAIGDEMSNNTYYLYGSRDKAIKEGWNTPLIGDTNRYSLKKQFRTNKRYSYLITGITSILESQSEEKAKLEALDALMKIATSVLCPICLDNQIEKLAVTKGLCEKHYEEQRIKKICIVPGCERTVSSRDYCSLHFDRIYHQGVEPTDLKTLTRPPKTKGNLKSSYPPTCTITGCERKHFSRGYCSLHWSRIFNSGIDPTDLEALNKPPRTIKKRGE